MRSSLFIFVIGFVLGGTLGFGGLYTQVLQPAWHEVEQLERENGVMKETLDEAGSALREAADSLRQEAGPEPMTTGDITGRDSADSFRTTRTTPEGDTSSTKVSRLETADRETLATRLDSIAGRLDRATKKDE